MLWLVKGYRWFIIPYLGYIEATVKITPIKGYDEYIPMLILKSSSPYSLRVPVQLGTTVLDRSLARITVEELAHASKTWQQTYMSTMITAKVAGTVETNNDYILTTDAPFVTTKPTVIPLFGCKQVNGLVGSLPACSYQVNVIAEPVKSHWITCGGHGS